MIRTGFIQYHSSKIAVYEKGSKANRSILFLHGNSEGAGIFKDQFDSSLSETFHLLALDFPGHGESSHAMEPENIYRISHLVQIVSKIIGDLNKPVVIAGSSLGGHIALDVSIEHPNLVKGIFVDGSPPIRSIADYTKASLTNPDTAALFQETISEEELKQLSATCLRNAKHLHFFENLVRKTDVKFRTFLMQSLLNNEIQDEIAIAESNQIPIGILHGEAEKIINKDYYESIKFGNLWRSQVQLILHAAHLPCLENPLLYNELLAKFMTEIEW